MNVRPPTLNKPIRIPSNRYIVPISLQTTTIVVCWVAFEAQQTEVVSVNAVPHVGPERRFEFGGVWQTV